LARAADAIIAAQAGVSVVARADVGEEHASFCRMARIVCAGVVIAALGFVRSRLARAVTAGIADRTGIPVVARFLVGYIETTDLCIAGVVGAVVFVVTLGLVRAGLADSVDATVRKGAGIAVVAVHIREYTLPASGIGLTKNFGAGVSVVRARNRFARAETRFALVRLCALVSVVAEVRVVRCPFLLGNRAYALNTGRVRVGLAILETGIIDEAVPRAERRGARAVRVTLVFGAGQVVVAREWGPRADTLVAEIVRRTGVSVVAGIAQHACLGKGLRLGQFGHGFHRDIHGVGERTAQVEDRLGRVAPAASICEKHYHESY